MPSVNEYAVGWICALPIERAAATAMLDAVDDAPSDLNDTLDTNSYTFGGIGPHNIVIAGLPSGHYGTNNAASVANNMARSFPALQIRLMVGVGGGVPGTRHDIRLGDVVVSQQVIQYDFGKTVERGIFRLKSHPIRPPQILLNAIGTLQAKHELSPSQIPLFLSQMLERHPDMRSKGYGHSEELRDLLFDATYEHIQSLDDDCRGCNVSHIVTRKPRADLHPRIHYGTVASGNQVMKHGQTRDRLAKEHDIMCFEMEAAGLMDSFPCLVVRGICDYSDSHKSKEWQRYGAATAAAFAKELLLFIPHVNKSTEKDRKKEQKSIEDRRRKLLKSLRFNELDSRLLAIKENHTKTCGWLLSHPDYQAWLNPSLKHKHHGFLWIKGNPGAGKSTIMKFAYGEQEKNKYHTIAIPFFFNARGDTLAHSGEGMYRSILHHLFHSSGELLSVLDEPTPHVRAYLDWIYDDIMATDARDIQWDVTILQQLLRAAIAKLSGRYRLMMFVDALDECKADEVRDMVDFFEDLGKYATANNKDLLICFSSRHYPHIDIKDRIELRLEDQQGHDKDISAYITSKLRIGESTEAQYIRNRVNDKARGIFMWVVLVVKILDDTFADGDMWKLRAQLDALPSKLSELFREIVHQDQKGTRKLQLCVQWTLFARRSLTLPEYYFAAISELSPESIEPWHRTALELADMSRFLLSSSRGLVEGVKSPEHPDRPSVQFIHESVREYFLKDGLTVLWPDSELTDAALRIQSHHRLHICCHRYLKQVVKHFDSGHFSTTKWPFARYTVSGGLRHAEDAATSGLLAANPLIEFCKDLLALYRTRKGREFIMTSNTTYPGEGGLLSLLAKKNCPSVITSLLGIDNSLTVDDDDAVRESRQPAHALFIALTNGRQEVFKALLYMGSLEKSDQEEIMSAIPFRENIKHQLPFREETPLAWAVRHRHAALARRILHTAEGIDVNRGDPLHLAVTSGQHDVVRLLLDKGAGFSQDSWRVAAELGHAKVVRVLLVKRSFTSFTVESKDPEGRTALHLAARHGRESTVRVLLHHGADVESLDSSRQIPLHYAILRGHEVVARVLLDRGWYWKRPNYDFLSLATREGQRVIVEMLIDRGMVPADEQPFLSTCRSGDEGIMRLLLDNGANANAKATWEGSPLHVAALHGREAAIRVLLEKGAVINSQNDNGQTPLSIACRAGYASIARLLVGSGADVNHRDRGGVTPLAYTARRPGDNHELVEFLLKNGADPNITDKRDLRPSVLTGSVAVRRLLREHERQGSQSGKRNTAGTKEEDEEERRKRARAESPPSSIWNLSQRPSSS
ncbi:putative ankyrin repeat protein [Triangularia setosa]|uniref:Ankyrin repeat protein n=1 Tax=Triangularia setosa TaxID=2587417 RepID=A0AAN7A626_9PEZI|nr:putative ankyrin repeat protein [Podospora setosa]